MALIGKVSVLLALCLSSIVHAAGPRQSIYLDTQGRLGYSMALAEWLDAGLAAEIYYKGLSIWRLDAGRGGSSGSVSWHTNAGLLLPIIDVHPAWSGMELGCRTYFSISDLDVDGNSGGEWIRSDLYLAYPVALERLEVVPSAYIMRYGYSLGDQYHEFGYGLLLEGRIAYRF